MLADDTAHVLAIITGLASETRRVRGEAHWQTGAIEYLITVKIGKRHFRGRDQPEFLLAVRHAKQIGCEFGELPCSVHRIGIDQVRRKHFALANFMLELHTREHGHSEVLPPYLVNSDPMYATAPLPNFAPDL